MKNSEISILVVDRPLRQGEHPVKDIFDVYREKGYDIVIFPYRDDKNRTEVAVLSYDVFSNIKDLFEIPHKEYDDDEILYDFDLEGITDQTFYDILDHHKFEVVVDNLTEIEILHKK